MECAVELVHGRRGQFEILVDGHTVVSRKGGLLAKFLGKPWPDPDDVVDAVQRAVQAAARQAAQ